MVGRDGRRPPTAGICREQHSDAPCGKVGPGGLKIPYCHTPGSRGPRVSSHRRVVARMLRTIPPATLTAGLRVACPVVPGSPRLTGKYARKARPSRFFHLLPTNGESLNPAAERRLRRAKGPSLHLIVRRCCSKPQVVALLSPSLRPISDALCTPQFKCVRSDRSHYTMEPSVGLEPTT
jgi:hypothetical protein